MNNQVSAEAPKRRAPFYNDRPPELSSEPITIAGTARPRVPDGKYRARLAGHRTFHFAGAPKVEFIYEILGTPDNKGARGTVGLFFPVQKISSPEGMNGRYEPKGKRSKLARFLGRWLEALGIDGPVSMSDLALHDWMITTETPTLDSNKKPIPESDRYSQVADAYPVRRY